MSYNLMTHKTNAAPHNYFKRQKLNSIILYSYLTIG